MVGILMLAAAQALLGFHAADLQARSGVIADG